MSVDWIYWALLSLKMLATAGIVVGASVMTERAGPLIGALIVTLPISAGPAYLFLSLDHDSDFIAASALGSLATNAVTAVFASVYVMLARNFSWWVSITVALAVWLALVLLARSLDWTLLRAGMLNVVVYAVCLRLTARFRHAAMAPTARRWYDLPLRTALVCTLVVTVLVLSTQLGPVATGVLAVFPIALTSTILIFHPRLGGEVAGAIIANCLIGLVGFGLALAALYLSARTLGSAAALTIWLAVCLTWNLTIFMVRRRSRRGRPLQQTANSQAQANREPDLDEAQNLSSVSSR